MAINILHSAKNESTPAVKVTFDDNTAMILTPHHLIPVIRSGSQHTLDYIRADHVKVGQSMRRFDTTSNTLEAKITKVEPVEMQGYMSPLTMNGNYVAAQDLDVN